MESELGFVVDGRGHRRFHRLLNNSVALFFAITEAGSDSDALDAIGAAVICAGCAIHSSIKGRLNNMNSNQCPEFKFRFIFFRLQMLRFSAHCGPNEQKFGELLT